MHYDPIDSQRTRSLIMCRMSSMLPGIWGSTALNLEGFSLASTRSVCAYLHVKVGKAFKNAADFMTCQMLTTTPVWAWHGQAGLRPGMLVVAISDPVRSGVMWPLDRRSSLRMVLQMLQFQRAQAVELDVMLGSADEPPSSTAGRPGAAT